MAKSRVIFLDRDGTVNRLIDHRPVHPKGWTAPFFLNEVVLEPYLGEALKIFRDFGYKIAVATNQPDVAYGYITEKRWKKIHKLIMAEVQPDTWIACKHRKETGCIMRKPGPGMLLAMSEFLETNLEKSFMIGDTEKDMLAGKRAGCKTILIRRSYNRYNSEANQNADYVVKSLLEATAIV